MKCQRCLSGEEASCRVRSDVIDMKVCAVCADEARRLRLTVEALGDEGRRGTGEKRETKTTRRWTQRSLITKGKNSRSITGSTAWEGTGKAARSRHKTAQMRVCKGETGLH
jgi:hypothetical protein